MIKFEQGDILDPKYKIFCHQVNCKGVMGAGLARQIRSKYPEVYKDYELRCQSRHDNLGSCIFSYTNDNRLCISMFAQNRYGHGEQFTDYGAFSNCLKHIKDFATYALEDFVIAFPYKIGCGLAGGDWNIIYEMLKELSQEIKQDVIIVQYK